MAGLEGHRASSPWGDTRTVPPEEGCQGLAQLLSSQPIPGDWSSSSSICTEDFAARFQESMVEPWLFPEEEEDEPTGDVPGDPGQDESLFPTGRRLDIWGQLVVEPSRHPLQGRSPALVRRESLESLGGRISRLSQGDALGMVWRVPQPPCSTQLALGQGHCPHGAPGSGRDPLTIALCREDLAAACPWRARDTSASRSRAGASRGSAGGHLPGASSARTRGHPISKPPRLRWQEPPALWGQRGGDIPRAVDAVEKEGAGSRQRAPCSAPRTNMAGGHPGQAGAEVSPWPGRVAGSCWQPGKQKPPRSSQRSREGTREMGPSVKGTWSKRDRARAGLGLLPHTQDTCQGDLMDLERMGQRACADCWERLQEERRKTLALQREKLQLQKRLRELEHRAHSLLQQNQAAQHQLHVLLQKEKVKILWQLQENLEQDRAGGSTRLQHPEHLLSHPWEPGVPGPAGCSLAMGSTSGHQHNPLPSSPRGQGPLAASLSLAPLSLSHTIRVLRDLQEQIQHQLQELPRMEGPQGPASQGKKLSHAQNDHPQPHPTSSQPLSIIPALQQRGRGALSLLHHLQSCLQELHLEETNPRGRLGNLPVLGEELSTTAREERWGQPETRDTPSATASPEGQTQNKEGVQGSSTEHPQESSSCWE
ncbi:uncharacterized protein [Heliangelus exortis]|uniref:uncharacterized protein isoform X2 n=1 Tax=Heliangelus exortis TaxID=472823 RepID=UPI003A95DD6D